MQSPSRRPVAIVGGARIPFCRSNSAYADIGNYAMSLKAVGAVVEKFNLTRETVGEVALGAVLKHSRDWNLGREVALSSGLSPLTPGITMGRACGTSLDTTIHVANQIALGQIASGIAGGSDTTSDVPVVVSKRLSARMLEMARAKSFGARVAALRGFRPREFVPEFPGVAEPRTGMSMGEHCELMARTWGIAREDQDRLALASHQRAAAAYERGFYKDLVVPFRGVERDNILRADTTLDKLSALKPAFDKRSGHGTLTAGNSTPLTDGASAVLLASDDEARARGWPVLAHFVHARVAAVDFVGGEGLLMAPTIAVAQLLDDLDLTLEDFDFYEIHEAFAAQVLCTLRAWESPDYCRERLGRERPLGAIDPAKLNVAGSSLAVGHPFAATGARIVATLAKLLAEKGAGRGLISVCTAGGMGVVAVLERR